MTAHRRYLLDTRTALAILDPAAPACLRQRLREATAGTLWLSALTDAALRAHSRRAAQPDRARAALDLLLRNVATVPWDQAAAVAYAAHALDRIDLAAPEAFLAAHAIAIEATLVSPLTQFDAVTALAREDWLRPPVAHG